MPEERHPRKETSKIKHTHMHTYIRDRSFVQQATTVMGRQKSLPTQPTSGWLGSDMDWHIATAKGPLAAYQGGEWSGWLEEGDWPQKCPSLTYLQYLPTYQLQHKFGIWSCLLLAQMLDLKLWPIYVGQSCTLAQFILILLLLGVALQSHVNHWKFSWRNSE